jgi:hypothetical protein
LQLYLCGRSFCSRFRLSSRYQIQRLGLSILNVPMKTNIKELYLMKKKNMFYKTNKMKSEPKYQSLFQYTSWMARYHINIYKSNLPRRVIFRCSLNKSSYQPQVKTSFWESSGKFFPSKLKSQIQETNWRILFNQPLSILNYHICIK